MAVQTTTLYDELPLRVSRRAGTPWGAGAAYCVEIVNVGGGCAKRHTLTQHNVTMLIESPLHTTVACDDRVQHRYQMPGQMDLLPSGANVGWVDRGAGSFITCDLDFDLARFEPQLGIFDGRIEHLLRALVAEIEDGCPHGRLFGEGIVSALALCIETTAGSRSANGEVPDDAQRRMKPVLEYVHAHLSEDTSLAELAGVAKMSPSHLKALFKRAVGMPVHQYVLRERVRLASRLLREGKLPLVDVALRAGFANQSHMAAVIRKFSGVTPRQLRATLSSAAPFTKLADSLFPFLDR
jgi:AraC family transcriptional regulator